MNSDLFNPQAEASVLGALMLDNRTWDEVNDSIREEDFYRSENRLIFNAITKLAKQNKPFDVLTIADALKHQGQIEKIGGETYLYEIAKNTPSAANVVAYAEIVHKTGIKRKAAETIDKLKSAIERDDENEVIYLVKNIEMNYTALKDNHKSNSLTSHSISDFLDLNLNPRENIVNPWMPTQGLVMLYAPRGIGKTFFSLTVAYAVASGSDCFCWSTKKPRGVLYLDGEMPANALQDRLAKLIKGYDAEPIAPLNIITRDLNSGKHFSVSDKEGQFEIEKHLDGIELIIADNLSTLTRIKENDGEEWGAVQEWLLKRRSSGQSVLLIHHAGKSGQQRGTSKREDILDSVISLRRPADYSTTAGAIFEVHFEKSRGFSGQDAAPVQLSLHEASNGRLIWNVESVESSTFEKVIALSKDGLSQKEIAEQLGIHKSNVSRHLKAAENGGLS